MSTPIADNLNIPDDQWITASVSGTRNISSNFSVSFTEKEPHTLNSCTTRRAPTAPPAAAWPI
jgi:hypothetical protein